MFFWGGKDTGFVGFLCRGWVPFGLCLEFGFCRVPFVGGKGWVL